MVRSPGPIQMKSLLLWERITVVQAPQWWVISGGSKPPSDDNVPDNPVAWQKTGGLSGLFGSSAGAVGWIVGDADDSPMGLQAAHCAACHDHVHVLQWLVDKYGTDVLITKDAVDRDPIMWAALADAKKVVVYLLNQFGLCGVVSEKPTVELAEDWFPRVAVWGARGGCSTDLLHALMQANHNLDLTDAQSDLQPAGPGAENSLINREATTQRLAKTPTTALWVTDVESPYDYGSAALSVAAMNGRLNLLQWMISASGGGRGIEDIMKPSQGLTALHCGALGGHIDVVSAVLAMFPSKAAEEDAVTTEGEGGGCCLQFAAQFGHQALFRWLLDRYKGCWTREKIFAACQVSIEEGFLHIMEYLLQEYGSSVLCTQDNRGNTALHTAAAEGHLSIVEWIARHYQPHATTNVRSDCKDKPVSSETPDGTPDSKKGNETQKQQESWSCHGSHEHLMLMRNAQGRTPLLCAIGGSHLDCVKFLANEYDALPDRQLMMEEGEHTAMHEAALSGCTSTVSWLLQSGFQWIGRVDSCDQFQNTPLSLATLNVDLSMLEVLLHQSEYRISFTTIQHCMFGCCPSRGARNHIVGMGSNLTSFHK
eukprot:TRINITY_DN20835_c0_g1_i2.p1 TRINITY_DN20835_c0_g1~~TRINITY_DN20835_c0_g1_i2.p1  ORF type:complete len:595 (+),score=22.81 TRINITY_DN20835_c0_g1_i2:358-2142(+)